LYVACHPIRSDSDQSEQRLGHVVGKVQHDLNRLTRRVVIGVIAIDVNLELPTIAHYPLPTLLKG
jgi:hypothetical protein